jgi:xanthine dehydrogenase YagS FAD-binding subunit
VESRITGSRLDGQTVSAAADAAVEGARPLEKNGYKIPLFRGVIQEELMKLAV